ncbi:hypothetical protein D3C78_1725060 [compost metagenome]
MDGGIGQPFAAHFQPGAARGGVGQKRDEQLVRLGRQQQGRCRVGPHFLQDVQKVRHVGVHGRIGVQVQLHSRELAGAIPQGAVTESQGTECRLDHGMALEDK